MAESEKVQGIISTIKELNVLELSQLVKALETEFGVTAAAPMAMAAAPAAGLLLHPPLKLKKNLNSPLS